VGLVFDHGSANLSGESIRYLSRNDIKVMPAGPGNPKGNGTCEGAFSEMKEVIGTVHLETSSPREMARMILEKIVSVYVKMRNRVPRFGERIAPSESMASPVLNKERENIKERYRKRIQKTQDPSQRTKLDRLDFIIRHHRLETDEKSLKRGQKCIVSYDLEAISKSEEAFLKAIRLSPTFLAFSRTFRMRGMKPGMRTIVAGAMDMSRYLRGNVKNKNRWIMNPQSRVWQV